MRVVTGWQAGWVVANQQSSSCPATVSPACADVANAFATSVGSRTLKLKWAILIAVVGSLVSRSMGRGRWEPLAPAAGRWVSQARSRALQQLGKAYGTHETLRVAVPAVCACHMHAVEPERVLGNASQLGSGLRQCAQPGGPSMAKAVIDGVRLWLHSSHGVHAQHLNVLRPADHGDNWSRVSGRQCELYHFRRWASGRHELCKAVWDKQLRLCAGLCAS